MKIPITLQLAVLDRAIDRLLHDGRPGGAAEGGPAPEVIEIAEDVSTEEMVQIGKTIYEGKGICYTCHANTSRYPDLQGIATRAATRKAGLSPRSTTWPSRCTSRVPTSSRASAPACQRDQQAADRPHRPEILSVIAYLQTLGGEATVTMETKTAYTGGAGDAAATARPVAETAMAQAARCSTPIGCSSLPRRRAAHRSAEPEPGGHRRASLTADQLLQKLYYHEGDDGLDQVTMVELESLVQYLSEQKGEQG